MILKSHSIFILFVLVVILFYNAVQTLKDDQMRDSRMMSTSENNPILVQNQEWLGEFIANTKKYLVPLDSLEACYSAPWPC